jgi:hypothetical protein
MADFWLKNGAIMNVRKVLADRTDLLAALPQKEAERGH